MKHYFVCFVFLLTGMQSWSQSSVLVRNNSWLDMEVRIVQSGSHALDTSEFAQATHRIIPWANDQTLLTVDRDSGVVPPGDSIFLEVQLIANGDTSALMLRLDGDSAGSFLDYSAALPALADAWWDDGSFHEIRDSFAGKDIIVKYRPENGDGNMDRDILFVIHQKPEYSINPADANDPHVLNVISYNIQFLPFFIGGFDNFTRAPLIPLRMDPEVDVVIFEEAFDPLPRSQFLIPVMQSQGFVHRTGILNDYLPFNGGVIIFSRWPIEDSDEYDFQLCGPNSGDCFANKGIMYAKVNKLGKRYHLFGTHMDAGSDADDLLAKNLQFAEMRDFIAAQNIPPNEPAIYAGDFNVRPGSGANLFANMIDSLNPLFPEYEGYWASTMSTDTGDIIDHAWVDRRTLIPLSATNEILTLRGIEDDMWDISDYSDHRTNLARFAFPDVDFHPVDTSLCPGDNITFSVTASGTAFTYQWSHNSSPLPGETSPSLALSNLQAAEIGAYSCTVSYSAVHGTQNDPVNLLFYPNGPETLAVDLALEGWALDLDCGVAAESAVEGSLRIFPNPTGPGAGSDVLRVELVDLPPTGVLRLRDVYGRVMVVQDVRGGVMEIEVQGVAAGVYFLEVEVGRRRVVERVLVR